MKFLEPDKVYEMNGVTVKDYLLTEHNPYKIELPQKRKNELLGITIHNTEAIVQASGTTMSEQYTRATVNGNMGTTRVHYYVDDVEAWHNLPDNWIGWHAADGSGNGNSSTIAIEVIGKTEKAEENAARLAAALLKANGLPENALYTHTHWLNVKAGKTGTREYLNTLHNIYKNCPAYILPHWSEFEKQVAQYYAAIPEEAASVIYRIQVGAFAVRENADKFLEKVKAAGFENAFITTVKK
ncbi:MAG: N-acetylmuramoyl-L-alanine amidase [Oscillospiraceae bacterium]